MTRYNLGIVSYDGEGIGTLNHYLVDLQNINEVAIERLKMLHREQHRLIKLAEQNLHDVYMLRLINRMIEEIRFELQRTWKFPMDKNFHHFWRVPGCKCPVIQNEALWPNGNYYINTACPVHGR